MLTETWKLSADGMFSIDKDTSKHKGGEARQSIPKRGGQPTSDIRVRKSIPGDDIRKVCISEINSRGTADWNTFGEPNTSLSCVSVYLAMSPQKET
jgi:hypothetical protein